MTLMLMAGGVKEEEKGGRMKREDQHTLLLFDTRWGNFQSIYRTSSFLFSIPQIRNLDLLDTRWRSSTIKRCCLKKIDVMVWHTNVTICWLMFCHSQFLKILLNLQEKAWQERTKDRKKKYQHEKERLLVLTTNRYVKSWNQLNWGVKETSLGDVNYSNSKISM